MGKGFTLVELAIVLVIIGLLVGGVLQGQELIKIAKYTSQISEWQEIKRADATYRAKYNKVPGDDNKASVWFGSGVGVGNNNRLVGAENQKGYYSYYAEASTGGGESCLYFHHMQKAGLLNITNIPDGITGCTGTSIPFLPAMVAGENIPMLLGDPTRAYVIYNEAAQGTTSPGVAGGDKIICTITTTHNSNVIFSTSRTDLYPVLTPEEANFFDTKLDDGLPMTGKTRATLGTTNNLKCSLKFDTITATNASTGTDCGNATGYNLTETRKACSIGIQMGF